MKRKGAVGMSEIMRNYRQTISILKVLAAYQSATQTNLAVEEDIPAVGGKAKPKENMK